MTIDFREFDLNQDYQAQRELFLLSFPETKGESTSSDEHYQWKFREFPAVPASYQCVALQEQKIIGYYAALPYKYMIKGVARTCGMVCDVMTHPEARGKGVFTKIGRFTTNFLGQKGVDFVSGYPIRPEVIPGHLKVGWFIAFKQPMYICVLKANSLLKSRRFISLFLPLINFFCKMYNWFFQFGGDSRYGVSMQDRDVFLADSNYTPFFDKWAREQQNYLLKNQEFLDWRTRAPASNYKFIKITFGGELVGVALVRITDLRGIPVVAILDLMLLKAHQKLTKNLFFFLKQFALQNGCEAIVVMMSAHCAQLYKLITNGFLRTPAVFSIIFKLLNSNLPIDEFNNVKDWHLMWIDSDDL